MKWRKAVSRGFGVGVGVGVVVALLSPVQTTMVVLAWLIGVCSEDVVFEEKTVTVVGGLIADMFGSAILLVCLIDALPEALIMSSPRFVLIRLCVA